MEKPKEEQKTAGVEQIEKILYDISSLFKRFGSIVQQHELLVERIDHNAEESLRDIEGANRELSEVYDSVSSNRKLMMKIFFVLLVFCTFYILFVL